MPLMRYAEVRDRAREALRLLQAIEETKLVDGAEDYRLARIETILLEIIGQTPIREEVARDP